MKSKLDTSANTANTNKRRRFDTYTSPSAFHRFLKMTSSDESERTSAESRKGSMSPESCNEDGEDGKTKVFACAMCSYRTDRKNNLKRHTLTMHELSQALLECCNLRFLNKAELRMHTQKYHADGYYCEVCDRNFCRKALLKRHFSVHSGFKEFSCHFCGYETSHKSNLERHMRVHRKASPLTSQVLPQPMNMVGRSGSGHFLSKVSTTCSNHHHLPPSVAFRTSLMSSQSHPILPSSHAQPPTLSMMGDPRHPPLGSSWPVLNQPPSATPLRTTINPFSEEPFHKVQESSLNASSPSAITQQSDPLSTPTKLKKKNSAKKDFSVSALLGEDNEAEDDEEAEIRKKPTSNFVLRQYQPANQSDRICEVLSSSSSSPTSRIRVPTGIQRPTPVHAHSRHFTHPFTTAYNSSFLSGPGPSSIYSQAIISLQGTSSQGMTKDFLSRQNGPSLASSSSSSFSLPSCPSPRAFASFRAKASDECHPPYERHTGLHLVSPTRLHHHYQPLPALSGCPTSTSIQPLQMRTFQQPLADVPRSLSGLIPTPVSLLNSTLHLQSVQAHVPMSLTHSGFTHPLHTNIHVPIRSLTPKSDNQDSGVSSGYASPGLDEPLRASGHSVVESKRKSQADEGRHSFLNSGNNSSFQSQEKFQEDEEEDDADVLPSQDPMDTDQEYIPKKLRASKKFQSTS